MDQEGIKDMPDRRAFLKCAAGLTGVTVAIILEGRGVVFAAGEGEGAAAAGGTAEAVAPAASPASDASAYDPAQHRYVYLIDISKCIGCGACVRACENENHVPKHFFRTWVEQYLVSREGHANVESPTGGRDGFDPVVSNEDITKAFFVPKMCNHCTKTPCVQLCPVGASYQSPDGVVLVDEKRCIGCSYCVQACPYGSRFIHPETHVANKCTWCYHRITKGLLPACVQACPAGVRQFGDEKKLHDRVAEIIATSQVNLLKPELMTEPNCYYAGLSKEVR